MNNIEILEKAIKVLTGNDTGIKLDFENTAQAIENLIKENKKLKDTNKKLYELCQGKAMQEFINNECGYIHKSKVKEKIEEYNKMINATYGDITHQGDIRRDNCIEIRNVLQELLKEGE